MRKKMMMLFLALAAATAAMGSVPRAEAVSCYWFCENGSVSCSCGAPRNCPWPPPPIACS